jgi:hypothetical protein
LKFIEINESHVLYVTKAAISISCSSSVSTMIYVLWTVIVLTEHTHIYIHTHNVRRDFPFFFYMHVVVNYRWSDSVNLTVPVIFSLECKISRIITIVLHNIKHARVLSFFFLPNCIKFHLKYRKKRKMSNDEICATIVNVFKFHIDRYRHCRHFIHSTDNMK